MARNRNRFKSHRYVLQVTRLNGEVLDTAIPFQPWLGPQGEPVWMLESPDEHAAFQALVDIPRMVPLFGAVGIDRKWTMYTADTNQAGDLTLRFPHKIKPVGVRMHYLRQLQRWYGHHPDEPEGKSMQRVLRGRRAGIPPDSLDFRKLLNEAKRSAAKTEAVLRSELARYKMKYEVTSNLLKDSQRREAAEKSMANSYVESAEAKILEVMRAAEKPAGETWPEAKPLFAMGWDYRSAPISIDMLMNTVTAFGTDGKKAVKDFLALYAVRSNQLGAGKPRATKLVLYAFNPLTRPAHGQLYIYQHDAPELNHIATLD